MKKILKTGKIPGNFHIFTCDICECQFMTDEFVYITTDFENRAVSIRTRCPWCDHEFDEDSESIKLDFCND